MASGTGNLPNQNMDFTPFDILTAEEMDDLVENIESLADGSGIGDEAIGTSALGQSVVTPDKLGLGPGISEVATSQGTSSTSYVDLATVQAVSVTVGQNGLLLVIISTRFTNNTQHSQNFMSFALSGANTVAADDANSIMLQAYANGAIGYLSGAFLLSGLNPGATTITAQFRVNSGTGGFLARRIQAIPL